ncbi:MAG TPA: 16S rRNA (uracil(1498)-N(3))-methyltransferase [Deltaproteobacteria bacterium]|nr:16S rRNA (uracil(1498)-N(3))-methyltransferase [Deltaproteobacteria bacterium]
MNLLLIEPEELEDGSRRVRVGGRRRRHAEQILRAGPGASLRVGVVGGRIGTARVMALDAETLDLEVRLERDPPPKLAFQLVLALPRPPVFRRLLSTVSSLGIERLLVVGTARTEKSFWQSRVVEPGAIRERLLLGLEQAGDTILPEVELHRYFEPLVKDVLPACLVGRRGLLAHPGAGRPCPHGVADPVTCFVGPEGGLLDHEIEKLVGAGFLPVDLGERVLRVEPVIPMLVGRLAS